MIVTPFAQVSIYAFIQSNFMKCYEQEFPKCSVIKVSIQKSIQILNIAAIY